MTSTIHVQHKEVLSCKPPLPGCPFGRMGENRGNNGGLEVPFTCCAAVGQTPPVLMAIPVHAQIHGGTWCQVPSVQRSTGLTDSGSKTGKVAHTISRVLLFPAGEEAVRLLRTWRTLWPFFFFLFNHHHLHQYIPVHVWCRRLCMWLLHACRQLVFVFTFKESTIRGGEDADWQSWTLLFEKPLSLSLSPPFQCSSLILSSNRNITQVSYLSDKHTAAYDVWCSWLWGCFYFRHTQTHTNIKFSSPLTLKLHINTLQCRLGWHTIFI